MQTPDISPYSELKNKVKDFWEQETCGTRYGESKDELERIKQIDQLRYAQIPEIPDFAGFSSYASKDILEIGVGAGTDFTQWIRANSRATGIDLTEAAIDETHKRLDLLGYAKDSYKLQVSDAENLPFSDNSFDVVYSWGVLHHSPDTPTALKECLRCLRPQGELKIMIYHSPSWMALIYWFRFALMRGKPAMSLKQVLFQYMESPGTKAYSRTEAENLVKEAGFKQVEVTPRLCQGDYLDIKLRDRHNTLFNRTMQRLFPKWLVKLSGHRFGGMLLIRAEKSQGGVPNTGHSSSITSECRFARKDVQ